MYRSTFLQIRNIRPATYLICCLLCWLGCLGPGLDCPHTERSRSCVLPRLGVPTALTTPSWEPRLLAWLRVSKPRRSSQTALPPPRPRLPPHPAPTSSSSSLSTPGSRLRPRPAPHCSCSGRAPRPDFFSLFSLRLLTVFLALLPTCQATQVSYTELHGIIAPN